VIKFTTMSDSMEPVILTDLEWLQENNSTLYNLFMRGIRLIRIKNHDYAGKDFYKNFREIEEFDVPGWKGIFFRNCDKWNRLKNFIKNGTYLVKDESFLDTALDMANYLLLMIAMKTDDEEKKNASTIIR
jgi:hypothetical protein